MFTTFFICGIFTFCVYRTIPRVRSLAAGWTGYVAMLVGAVMATITILSGNATVLDTFLLRCSRRSNFSR